MAKSQENLSKEFFRTIEKLGEVEAKLLKLNPETGSLLYTKGFVNGMNFWERTKR
jgi:hypothetical protein